MKPKLYQLDFDDYLKEEYGALGTESRTKAEVNFKKVLAVHELELSHKGLKGISHYEIEDGMYYGRVANVANQICYKGKDIKELEESFIKAIEQFLDNH